MTEYISTMNELRDFLEAGIASDMEKSRTKQSEFNYIRRLYKKFVEINHYGFSMKEFVEAYYEACIDLFESNQKGGHTK